MNTGNLIAAGDVQSNSDERLKENVETIENALDKVSKLRGVYFDMKAKPGVRKVGLIAQEVEEVLPEVVSTDSEGDKIKSVAYANVVGLLVEAIKELKDEVDQLKG
jgi:glycerophosphoryl diester phosphodiesterase